MCVAPVTRASALWSEDEIGEDVSRPLPEGSGRKVGNGRVVAVPWEIGGCVATLGETGNTVEVGALFPAAPFIVRARLKAPSPLAELTLATSPLSSRQHMYAVFRMRGRV